MNIIGYEEFKKSAAFFSQKPSRNILIFLLTVSIVIIALIGWALIGKMDDVVRASAILRPMETISVVRALYSGEIDQKYYAQDIAVKEGDFLFSVDVKSEIIERENNEISISVISEQKKELEYLLISIARNRNTAPEGTSAWIRCESYNAEYNRKKVELEQMETELKREKEKPASIQTRGTIEDKEAAYKQLCFSIETWQNSRYIETSDTIKKLQQNIYTLEQRNASLDRIIKNANAYAPITGRIVETRKLNAGDTVLAGEEILKIIPEGEHKLKAEIMVDPSYIASLKVGQVVHMKFPGLHASKYGYISTNVAMIPADATVTKDGSMIFIIEAAVNEPYLISSSGEKLYLQPGISASARIIVDRSSVMQMIFRRLDLIE